VLSTRQRNVPKPHNGLGLLDTGASHTCIDEGIATALNLQVANRTTMRTAAGQASTSVFAVTLSFPGTSLPPMPSVFALGANLGNQGLAALIGRDFLAGKILHYDGALSIVTLSW